MTRILLVAALTLAGCGGSANPCDRAGTYCADLTLCVDGVATDCSASVKMGLCHTPDPAANEAGVPACAEGYILGPAPSIP